MSRWWRNAGTDEETAEIDRSLEGKEPGGACLRIRNLIGGFEACHHKAQRRLELIVDAIGAGDTDKRPGRRSSPGMHPAEQSWQAACDILRAWQADEAHRVATLCVGPVSAKDLLEVLGGKTRLKVWQVQRVIERIDSFLHRDHRYDMLVCDEGDYGEPGGRPLAKRCESEADLLAQTRTTVIHDTDDGQPREMSLALAIDMLMPCHWDFPNNLLLVAQAIGGELHCRRPFAACGRNIRLSPLRPRAQEVITALDVFSGKSAGHGDAEVLRRLGDCTPERKWLAASLAKTLRLQLHL